MEEDEEAVRGDVAGRETDPAQELAHRIASSLMNGWASVGTRGEVNGWHEQLLPMYDRR